MVQVGVEDAAEHLSEELVVAMVVVLDQQAVARTIECLQDVPRITESATRAVALGIISASISLLERRRVDSGYRYDIVGV
jgi:hypothetical protein